MASPVNECIPLFRPGSDITGHATAAITGKRFVDISATVQSGPGLSSTAEGGNIRVAPATAAGNIFGVAAYDVASGGKVPVIRGAGTVVPVTADGAITAGDEIEVGATGKAKLQASGIIVGRAINTAADAADVFVSLYH